MCLKIQKELIGPEKKILRVNWGGSGIYLMNLSIEIVYIGNKSSTRIPRKHVIIFIFY